ncbi:MAG: energy transducer TonB [Oxalobacteraceae bacterium]|nr:MAG: energy transducer TonB [Oxalobacteraceae bacterium]
METSDPWRSHALAARAPAPAVPYVSAGRYGEQRKFSPTAIGVTLAIHVVLGAAMLSLGVQAVSERKERLSVFDVSLESLPPPPPSAPDPQPATLTTQVQPPVIQLMEAQAVPVPVTLDPVPQPDIPRPAVPAAPAAPLAPPAPAAPPSIISSSDLGTRMISGDPPRYPLESRRKKEQGVVELLVIVGPDGRVETITVNGSSGHSRLDEAALKAVRRWRWEPTLRGGTAVRVRGIVEIPFVLQSAG